MPVYCLEALFTGKLGNKQQKQQRKLARDQDRVKEEICYDKRA